MITCQARSTLTTFYRREGVVSVRSRAEVQIIISFLLQFAQTLSLPLGLNSSSKYLG